MKLEIIAGSPFVRDAVKTRPYADVLAGLRIRAAALAAEIDARADALKAARASLASALADGIDVDRESATGAETALSTAREQLAAVRAQLSDLLNQHAAAVDKQRLSDIKADLASIGRTFDTTLKRIAA